MAHIKNKENETKFERRTFLSVAFSSAAVMLAPNLTVASDLPNSDISPSPADSLTFYLEFLDQIRNEVLRKFVAEVGLRGSDVRKNYEKLAKLVAELEKEVPELKNSKETSQLKNVTDVGLTSASRVKPVMQNGIFLSALYVELISISTNSLNNSVNQLQQESITLSPKAVQILKEILQEIRSLDDLTSSLNEATEELTNVITDLNPKIDVVRKKLTDAISVLVRGEIKSLKSEGNQAEAIQLIQSAISALKELDNLSLIQQPRNSTDKLLPTSLQQNTASASQTSSSTILLRGLLEDTIKWILKGGQITISGNSRRDSTVKFVTASTNRTSVASGLWWEVRNILAELLPESITTRAIVCIGLISPVLLAGHELSIREEKIYGLIPSLRPRGKADFSDANRRQAAQRLARLEV